MIYLKNHYLIVEMPTKQKKLFFEQIIFVSHQKGITIFHLNGDKCVKTPMPFKTIQSRLSLKGFLRINRCKMVNLKHIELVDFHHQSVQITGGETLPVSRRRLKSLKEAWIKFSE